MSKISTYCRRFTVVSAVFCFPLFAQPVLALEMVQLAINGDNGLHFKGDCYLFNANGKKKQFKINGSIPAKYLLPAKSIRCIFQKNSAKGRIFATVSRKGQEEITQQSRYPYRWLSVASSGPWGMARGGAYPTRPKN